MFEKQTEQGYNGPTNLTHYTVHEFNEAVFFALREYSSYINFSQVEHATYHFFMDNFLLEQNKRPENIHAKGK